MLQYFTVKIYQSFPVIWHLRQFPINKKLKFGMKVGLVAGTMYYVSSRGVWRDSDAALMLRNQFTTNLAPYTKEITNKIPYQLPSLPATDEVSYLAKYYWNKGVILTFSFLANVPSYIGDMTNKGVSAVMDNADIKNLFIQSADNAETKKD